LWLSQSLDDLAEAAVEQVLSVGALGFEHIAGATWGRLTGVVTEPW
jgi:hypothetical protein